MNGGVVGVKTFFGDHFAQMRRDAACGDRLEIKSLASTLNCGGHFVRLGGAQNKFHVRRRLLHGLQQRVECRRGEHVHFVNDVNFVRAARRQNSSLGDQVARVVHAAIAGAVDLDHIHVFAAKNAACDRVGLGQFLGRVERARQHARHAGLAHPARAAK